MSKYKYVDFSRKTAKRNPDMIIREYQRLLAKVSELLEKEYSTENEIYINIKNVNDFTRILRQYSGGSDYDNPKWIKAKFNFKELSEIFKELQGKKENVKELQKEKYELIKELRKFKEQYVYKETLGYDYF